VALILDIDLKLHEQPSVSGRSVNSIAGSQRSLRARVSELHDVLACALLPAPHSISSAFQTDSYRLPRHCQYRGPIQVGAHGHNSYDPFRSDGFVDSERLMRWMIRAYTFIAPRNDHFLENVRCCGGVGLASSLLAVRRPQPASHLAQALGR
jgi:hypothetical protein